MKINVRKIIDETIQEYINNPIDLMTTGDTHNELKYISTCRASYVRTITDVINYFHKNDVYDFSGIRVLEIGSFLGIVAVTLSRLGFSVTALDIPEFMANKKIQNKFEQHNIEWHCVNLADYRIPCDSDKFDLIIMCEVLEHLNFNPLPVLAEVNRITVMNGVLYLALPNLTRLRNRINMLFGRSIHESIDGFINQLNKNDTMIVGIHWREYTLDEIKYTSNKLGFKSVRSYLTSDSDFYFRRMSLRGLAKIIIFTVLPSLSFHQVHFLKKIRRPSNDLLQLLSQ